MTEIAFRIDVPQEAIGLLQQKLALSRLPDELEDVGDTYGTPLSDVERLVGRWRNGYDWKKHEQALNDELPQFTRYINVEGYGTLNVHYVHKKSDVGDATPLLFIHGCKFCPSLFCP